MSLYRKLTCKNVCNPSLITAIIILLTLNFIFVYEFMIRQNPWYKVLAIIIQQILFILLVWSFIMTIITDPGQVDPFWHILQSIKDSKMPRKYCLHCKTFKPQRTHHCSTCHKCNLNMDHHCPWVSNCVGFRNRKFFLLFVFYCVINLVFLLSCQIPLLIKEIKLVLNNDKSIDFHLAIQLLTILMQIFFFFLLGFFFAYHLDLVLSNINTIEEMDEKRKAEHEKHNRQIDIKQNKINRDQQKYNHPQHGQWKKDYDVGSYNNFCQVFGSNCISWLIPTHPRSTVNGWKWPTSRRVQQY